MLFKKKKTEFKPTVIAPGADPSSIKQPAREFEELNLKEVEQPHTEQAKASTATQSAPAPTPKPPTPEPKANPVPAPQPKPEPPKPEPPKASPQPKPVQQPAPAPASKPVPKSSTSPVQQAAPISAPTGNAEPHPKKARFMDFFKNSTNTKSPVSAPVKQSQPAPAATPTPAPTPVQSPVSAPAPAPTPKPSAPEPKANPVPAPQPKPEPPKASPQPKPVQQPSPAPVTPPAPASDSSPAPSPAPAPKPSPAPIPKPAPKPALAPPKSTATTSPKSMDMVTGASIKVAEAPAQPSSTPPAAMAQPGVNQKPPKAPKSKRSINQYSYSELKIRREKRQGLVVKFVWLAVLLSMIGAGAYFGPKIYDNLRGDDPDKLFFGALQSYMQLDQADLSTQANVPFGSISARTYVSSAANDNPTYESDSVGQIVSGNNSYTIRMDTIAANNRVFFNPLKLSKSDINSAGTGLIEPGTLTNIWVQNDENHISTRNPDKSLYLTALVGDSKFDILPSGVGAKSAELAALFQELGAFEGIECDLLQGTYTCLANLNIDAVKGSLRRLGYADQVTDLDKYDFGPQLIVKIDEATKKLRSWQFESLSFELKASRFLNGDKVPEITKAPEGAMPAGDYFSRLAVSGF